MRADKFRLNNFSASINLITTVKKLAFSLGLDSSSTIYIVKRTESEGLSFLTKTLPKLSKAVLKSLELGYFDRTDLTCFRWKGASLLLCRSWLSRIFSPKGVLLTDACPYAIRSIRMLCEYFYKFVVPFKKRDLQRSEEDYENTEHDLSSISFSQVHTEGVRKVFETLYPRIARATVDDMFTQHRPRFTSGSFAKSSNLAISYAVYKSRSDVEIGTTSTVYRGKEGYFKPYPSSKTSVNTIQEALCSEVLFVPKDSRGPRVISKEPLHLLRGQMALFDFLVTRLEKDSCYRINFRSQEINQKLAYKGSIDKQVATMDLQSASDRVSVKFCRRVFKHSPALRWFVNNARSTHTTLPSGKVLRLNKLSGMGSGLTFPIMALLIQCTVIYSVKQKFPKYRLRDIMKEIYVYGDDIVLPTKWYDIASKGLGLSGFKVNNSKSYSTSFFRESCGADFYCGVNVGPVRLKLSGNDHKTVAVSTCPFINLKGPRVLLQLERHCRELVKNHLLPLAEYYYSVIEKSLGICLPVVSNESPILGRFTDSNYIPPFKGGKVIVSTPIRLIDDQMCPYKYLSKFFRSTSAETFITSFGSVTKPYGVELKFVTPRYERFL